MDILAHLGLDSLDGATFAVAGVVFLTVEIAKLAAPASLLGSPRGERLVRLLPLILGAAAGVLLLREDGGSVVGDSWVAGLRRGFGAGALAMVAFELWRVGPRRLSRWVLERLRGGSAGSRHAGKSDLIELDPRHPQRRRKHKYPTGDE